VAASILTGTGNVTTDSNSNAASLTIAKPANLANGHLMIAGIMFRNTGVASTPPAGWSLFSAEALDNGTTEIFYKAVPSAAAETATNYTWTTSNGSNRCCGFIALVSNADLTTPEDAAGATATSQVAPSVTTAAPNALLVAVNAVNIASATPLNTTAPTGMTEAVEVSAPGTSTTTLQLSQEVIASAGATGTRTFTFSGTPGSQRSFMFAIEPLVTIVDQTASDSSTLTDTASLTRAAAVVDAAALSDVSALTQSLTATDSSALSDSSALTQARTPTDSATLGDTAVQSEAHTATDSATLDEATVTPTTNLVTRPSAEVAPLFGSPGWATLGLAQDPTLAVDTTRARFGASSVRFDWPTGTTGGGGGYVADNNLVIGQTYTATVYVWVPTGAPHVQLKAFFIANGTTSNVNDQWQRLTVTWTASTVNDYLIVANSTAAAAGQHCWVDGFQIETGTAATSYIDGDQPAGRWTGTAHQSTSVREALIEGFTKAGSDTVGFDEAVTDTAADDNADTGSLTAETSSATGTTSAVDAAAVADTAALATHDPVDDTDQATLDDQAAGAAAAAASDSLGLAADQVRTLDVALSRTDTAAAADLSAVTAVSSRTDLGTISDVSALTPSAAVSDSAAVVDVSNTTSAAARTDQAALTDTSAVVTTQGVFVADGVTLGDASSPPAVAFAVSDTLTTTDAITGAAAATAADTGTATDQANLNAGGLVSAGDPAALTEAAAGATATTAADTAAVSDSAIVDVQVAAADAVAGAEAAGSAAGVTVGDSAAVADSSSTGTDGLNAADTAVLAEAAAVVTAALTRLDFAVLGEVSQIGVLMDLDTFDIITLADTASLSTGQDQDLTGIDGGTLSDGAVVTIVNVPTFPTTVITDPTLVVSVDQVARRAGLLLPLPAETEQLVREAILDKQAVVESYLGVPIVPRDVTETGRWPVLEGWNLTYEPLVAVGAVVAELTSGSGHPTGTFTVTYTWGLNAASGTEYEPIRRWLITHAGTTPEMRRLLRTADETAGSVRKVQSLSAEGQSVSYSDDLANGGSSAADALVDATGLPTLRTLDRWRRANRRIYQRA
jgi:hypothetical protein